MKRRQFIKQTAATGALIGSGALNMASLVDPSIKKITILHTNDVHSHIDPFGPEDGRNANKGGVSRRATLVERIRQQNPNTLVARCRRYFSRNPLF